MEIQLNIRSRTPIYIQIIQQIQQAIWKGNLRPGEQLPTVRAMAQDLGVNFNTIARAYRLLDQERMITTHRGRGTYVLEPEAADDPEIQNEKVLQRLAQQYINEAMNLDYDRQEARRIFDEAFAHWKLEPDK